MFSALENIEVPIPGRAGKTFGGLQVVTIGEGGRRNDLLKGKAGNFVNEP